MVDFLRQCVLAAGCLAASVAPLLAQGAGGRISGTVTDQTGGAVAGATVTVTNVETNRRRSVSSSRDGMYTAASLAPGDYRVEVERSGFKSVRRDAVRVAAGERARIDVELPVGDLSEQVTITAGAPLLRTDTASLDMPHVFVSSVVWDLPAGAGRVRQLHGIVGALANDWTVASLVTLQSGMPIAVTQATNFNAFAGFGVQRPHLVGNPTLPADRRTPGRWFDTAAFALAPQFTIGSASRNPVRGPSYRNVDLALVRRISLGSAQVLEVRGEVFNLLNTPLLGGPNAVLGAANFGTITTAGDPRVVQLAMKWVF